MYGRNLNSTERIKTEQESRSFQNAFNDRKFQEPRLFLQSNLSQNIFVKNLQNSHNGFENKFEQYQTGNQFYPSMQINRPSSRQGYSQLQIQAFRQQWNKKFNEKEQGRALLNAKNSGVIPSYLIKSGKFYDDDFKRQTVLTLLRSSKNIEEQQSANIRELSHNLGVHPFQISIWVSALKIVFQVESEMQKTGNLSDFEKQNIIDTLVLSYMLKNQKSKKYKLVKLVQQIFKHLNLPDPRPSGWMNKFVFKYQDSLQGIDLSQYNMKAGSKNIENNKRGKYKYKKDKQFEDSSDKNYENYIDNESEQPSVRFYNNNTTSQNKSNSDYIRQKIKLALKNKQKLINQSNLINRRQENNNYRQNNVFMNGCEENEKINVFPNTFKINIANKIDEVLKHVLQQAVKYHSKQLALPEPMVNKIHQNYGAIGYKNELIKLKQFQPQSLPNRQQIINNGFNFDKFKPTNNNFNSVSNTSQFNIKTKEFDSLSNDMDENDCSINATETTFDHKDLSMINLQQVQSSKELYSQLKNQLNGKLEQLKEEISDGMDYSNSQDKKQCQLQWLLQLEEQALEIMEDLGFSDNLKNDVKLRWMGLYFRSQNLIKNDVFRFQDISTIEEKQNHLQEQINSAYEEQKVGMKISWVLTQDNQIQEEL